MILDSALELASRGFRVFPLQDNSKLPRIDEFYNKATVEEAQIRYWWKKWPNANIGISTDDLYVLDIDKKKRGFESLEEFWGKEPFPKTCVQTTATGGKHVIFKTETAIKNSASKLGPGLDTRGFHGYIVGAGSIIDGVAYTINKRDPIAVPERFLSASLAATPKDPKLSVDAIPVDKEVARSRSVRYLKSLEPVLEGSRDSEGFKVAARLRDFGLDPDEIFQLLQDSWKHEPRLDDSQLRKLSEQPNKSALNQQGSDSPEAFFEELPPENNEDPVLELNKEYAFVTAGGGYHILHETKDENGNFYLDHLSGEAFDKKLIAKKIQVGNKRYPMTKIWMEHPERRSYDRIIFSPKDGTEPNFYNLWRGFETKPLGKDEIVTETMKRGVELFWQHVFENICQEDIEHYQWVKSWLSHIIQKPWEKPETALVLRGAKGTGKTILFETMNRLMPSNYYITADRRDVFGNFNQHLEKTLLLVLDEALWSGDKEAEGKLKLLITGDKTNIEKKGVDKYTVGSYLRLAIIGNESWVVPASEDERRFAVFDVTNGRRQDREFFGEMMDCMKNGADRYLFTQLQSYEISKNVFIAPATKALIAQKEKSLDPLGLYWLDCITKGYIIQSGNDEEVWDEVITVEQISNGLTDFYRRKNIRSRIPTDKDILNFFQKVYPDLIVINAKIKFPNLKTVRDQWDNFLGKK